MAVMAVVSAASGTDRPRRLAAYGTLDTHETALVVAECPFGWAAERVRAALEVIRAQETSAPNLRIRAALAAAERAGVEAEGAPPPTGASVVVVIFAEDRCHTGQIGASTRACLVREETLIGLCPGVDSGPRERPRASSEAIHVGRSAFAMRQSDRVVLLTSGVVDTVEDLLLPKLMARRPPERCVDSILKLARHRGLGEDFVLVVAAWQDPALITMPHEFVAPVPRDESGETLPEEVDLGVADVLAVDPLEAPEPRSRGSLLAAAMSLMGLGRATA